MNLRKLGIAELQKCSSYFVLKKVVLKRKLPLLNSIKKKEMNS
jgi:hypothetical protein